MADQRLSLAPGALAKAKDAIEILSSLASSVSEQSSTHPVTSGEDSVRITQPLMLDLVG